MHLLQFLYELFFNILIMAMLLWKVHLVCIINSISSIYWIYWNKGYIETILQQSTLHVYACCRQYTWKPSPCSLSLPTFIDLGHSPNYLDYRKDGFYFVALMVKMNVYCILFICFLYLPWVFQIETSANLADRNYAICQ